jgi:hypothetical protein
MDNPQDPTTEEPNLIRSRTRRLVAVATGTTLALGAGGIAYAATSDPTPAPSSSTPSDVTPDDESGEAAPDFDGDHADGAWGHGPGVAFGGVGALHGEFVVETSDGVYETVATQRGTIDEISADSLTVTSEDGYSKTYVLDSAALDSTDPGPVTDPADLAAGDEVVVTASVDGSTAMVTRVIDLANLPDHPPFGGPGGGPHGDRGAPPGTEPTPDPSETATS